jgi:hypothetical protein
VACRRFPFSVTVALSLSAAASSAALFFTGRGGCGLADVQWRLAVVRCAFALGLGHLSLWGVSAMYQGLSLNC